MSKNTSMHVPKNAVRLTHELSMQNNDYHALNVKDAYLLDQEMKQKNDSKLGSLFYHLFVEYDDGFGTFFGMLLASVLSGGCASAIVGLLARSVIVGWSSFALISFILFTLFVASFAMYKSDKKRKSKILLGEARLIAVFSRRVVEINDPRLDSILEDALCSTHQRLDVSQGTETFDALTREIKFHIQRGNTLINDMEEIEKRIDKDNAEMINQRLENLKKLHNDF